MSEIVCLALGSRGDFQPFLALAQELKILGRDVTVAGLEDYETLAKSVGISFAPIGGRISELMDWEMVYRSQRNPFELGRIFRKLVSPLLEKVMSDCAAACDGSTLVLASTLALVPAYELGLEVVPVHFHPVGATREVPSVHFPWLPSGPISYASHVLSQLFFWRLMSRGDWFKRARRVWKHQDKSVFYAYPKELLSRPKDWPRSVEVCGPWVMDCDPVPAPELQDFLDSGEPPVYIGFGSLLAGRNPDRVTTLLARALELTGNRGIIYRGWGDLARLSLPKQILAIDSVDHRWLFPQCKAVVTHGGIGTVTAALQASVPPLVVPFFGDQRLWARRLESLGVAGSTVPRNRLTANSLAQALQTIPSKRLSIPNRVASAAKRVEALLLNQRNGSP